MQRLPTFGTNSWKPVTSGSWLLLVSALTVAAVCTKDPDEDDGASGPMLCGNGVLDPFEQCDESIALTETCEGLGLLGGPLFCEQCSYAGCTGADGDPCSEHLECLSGICLPLEEWGWPGGYCSGFCDLDEDCLGGGVCAWARCHDPCATSAECRPDYTCQDLDGDGRRECVGLANGSTPVGGPCNDVASCAGDGGGGCMSPVASGGYCTLFCADGTLCPNGSHCVVGLCLEDCSAAADCRAPHGCSDYDGDSPDECTPTIGMGGCECNYAATCESATCRCDPDCVPEGWLCNALWYDDGFCDCGCGVDDLDCGGDGCTTPGCCVSSACAYCAW
jgi:hypothetical protein